MKKVMSTKKQPQHKENKKGFTLIEVLLAVFIFSMGVVAFVTLMTVNIQRATESKNEIIGAQLAQEGVELIRNFRDNNDLNVPTTGFNNMADNTWLCPKKERDIVSDGAVAVSCPGGSNKLYINASSGYTTSSTGNTDSFFLRGVRITPSGTGKTVVSRVWWNGNATPPSPCNLSAQCVEISTDMSVNGVE